MSVSAILAGQVAIEAKIDGINKAVGDLGRLGKSMNRTAKNTSAMAKATKMARGALALLVGINVVQRNISKFAGALMQTVDAMDLLDKASKRLGMTVSEFQSLSIATKMAGVEFEQLQTGFSSMQRNIGMFAMGAGEAKVAFEQLGLSMSDFAGKTATEQMGLIADRLNEFKDPAEKASLAMKIFGEGGMRLLPFLNQGSEGFSQLTRDVKALTGGLDEGVVDSMVEIKDLLAVFGESRQMAQANFFSQFTDVIRVFTLAFMSAAQSLKELDFDGLLGGVLDFNMDLESMKKIAKTTAAALLSFFAVIRVGISALATLTMIGGFALTVFARLGQAIAAVVGIFNDDLGYELTKTTDSFAAMTEAMMNSSAAIVGSSFGDLGTILGSINDVNGSIEDNAEGIWNAWNNTRKTADGSIGAFKNITDETGKANENVKEIKRNLESFAGMAIEFGGIEAEQKIQQNIENQRVLKTLSLIEANTRNQFQIETY